jgi:hypothetical protein
VWIEQLRLVLIDAGHFRAGRSQHQTYELMLVGIVGTSEVTHSASSERSTTTSPQESGCSAFREYWNRNAR